MLRAASLGRRLLAQPAARRLLSTPAARADGFSAGLPPRSVGVPIIAFGLYGLGWAVTEDGRITQMTKDFESTMKNMDPEKLNATIPSPDVVWNLVWPIATGLLTSLFESIAARLALSSDMAFLCDQALDADFMAPTSIALLSFPADHPGFVEALWDRRGVDKVWNIINVYRTLPPEQHDDVLTNACIIAAKAAASPRGTRLDATPFVWMLTKESCGPCASAGIEGLAHLWQRQRVAVLKAPVISELQGLRTSTLPTRLLVGELANRLLCRMAMDTPAFQTDADAARAYSLALLGPAPSADKKTVWQSTGVSCGVLRAAPVARATSTARSTRAPIRARARPPEREVARAGGAVCSPAPLSPARSRPLRHTRTHTHARACAPRPIPSRHAAGVSQRETSSAAMRRQLEADLDTVDSQLAILQAQSGKATAPTLHERYGIFADVVVAGALGGAYGYARAFARARWRDITPSTARALGAHVGRRSALGVMLLIALQEGAVQLKRERYADVLRGVDALRAALGLGGAVPAAPPSAERGGVGVPPRYTKEGLNALIAIDLANIAALGVISFVFPYCILPTLLQPLQFLVPPGSPSFPLPRAAAERSG